MSKKSRTYGTLGKDFDNYSNNNNYNTTWQFICNYCGFSEYRSSKHACCILYQNHHHMSKDKQIIMYQSKTNTNKILYSQEIESYLKYKREELLDFG